MERIRGFFKYTESNITSQTGVLQPSYTQGCTNMPSVFEFGDYNFTSSMPSLGFMPFSTRPPVPLFDLSMPSLSANSAATNSSGISLMNSDVNINTNHNFGMDLSGYNAQKGSKLASYALSHHAGRWNSKCATYVKNAIQAVGLGQYVQGHGYQMVEILSKNPNFKRVSNTLDVNSLPAGCILVYGRGVAGYNAQYGHVEITTGKGTCVSDNITRHPRQHPTAIFIPV